MLDRESSFQFSKTLIDERPRWNNAQRWSIAFKQTKRGIHFDFAENRNARNVFYVEGPFSNWPMDESIPENKRHKTIPIKDWKTIIECGFYGK